MRNRSIKLFITIVAAVVISLRVYKPEITIDATTLTLLVLGVLPWLSPVIKSFEGLGIKVEFQNAESTLAKEQMRARGAEALTVDRRSAAPGLTADSYFDRLVKLTPVEIVVAFIVTNAMVTLTGSIAIVWTNFLALVALTPLFLWHVAGVMKAGQLIAST